MTAHTLRVATLCVLAAACAPERDSADDLAPADTAAAPLETDTPAVAGDTLARDASPLAAPPAGAPPGAPTTPATPPVADRESHAGRVAVSGTAQAPLTTLAVPGGPTYLLTGRYEPELRRLAGADVRVEGMPVASAAATPARPRAFEVRGYEIIAIDGDRPEVGVLVLRAGVWWLEGARNYRLSGVPVALSEQAGATVWIVGHPAEDALHVQSYGVIRER